MRTVKLSNGKKVEAYPLIPAQHLMLYLSEHHSTDAPVLNIVTGYYWQGEFDTAIMKEALYEAVERCDAMRIRFKKGFRKTYQYLADKAEIEITEEDLSAMKWDDAHEFIKQRSHSIIDMYEKPVNEIKIMHLENDYHGIYMKLHHLAFDGYSSKAFLADAISIYLNKKYGTAYPKPMRKYLDMVEKELQYSGSEQHKKDKEYWKGTIKNFAEPIYTDYVRPSRLKEQRIEKKKPNLRKAEVLDGDNPSSRTLKFSLDAETSARLMQLAAERSLSLPCMLMMGMRTALSSFNDDEKDISYKLMVNRRATLLDKKAGGVRMHFYSMRNIVEPEMTFEQAVRVIEKSQNEIFEHSNISPMEAVILRHLAMKSSTRYTYECITFSYHPHFQMPYYGEDMKNSSRGFWYNNDASVQPLYLTVMHRSYDNGLDFNFEYRICNNPGAELLHFYDKLHDTLMLGLENPDITVKEILDKIREDKVH